MREASRWTDEPTQLQDDEILALVHTRTRRFRRQIRFRDWRELVASGVVAVMIAPAAIRGPIVSRLGATIILAGLVVVAYRLRRAGRLLKGGAFDPTLPVAAALQAELAQVDAQITLLDSVGWWYVAPLIGGSIVLVAGGRATVAFAAGYALFAALLGWGIITLNRRAVRRTLRPRREEVAALLAGIES